MLNIYCGGEHTDREKFIFEHIKGRTLLIVPDQFSLQAERDAFFYLKEKSIMDLRVVNFSSLGHKVVAQTCGKKPQLIDKYGRHMLLAKIMDDVEGDLNIYKGMSRRNSFIDMLNSVISEMKRSEVTPEDLEEGIASLDSGSYLKYKLEDILTVYRAYQSMIEGKYLDSEDYISFYGELIMQAPMVKESEIWIYGFDTFTPKNLLVIERLLKAARNVNIVMTYEPGNEIFDLTEYVIGKLTAVAEGVGEEVVRENITGELRRTVWNRRDGALPVTLAAVSNVYAEAERAAAYVLELVREKGYRFGDIVAVCNDMDVRGGILKRTFMRWDIPVFMDRKRTVLHHQAVSFLLALMETVSGGYRDDALMRIVKSEITGFDDDEKDILENYVKQFRIRGSMWKKPFSKGDGQYDAEELNSINALRETVADIIETARQRIGARNTAEEKIRGLYAFLEEDMDIIQRLEDISRAQEEMGLAESAAETAQSWNVICGIFDQIVETVGEERISNEALLKLMTAGFEETEIGLVPVSSDCVIIGTVQRTRLSRLKALLVVGANEGVLPLGRGEEGLLSEREKDVLQDMDLDFSKRDEITRQEEQLALYRTFCLPEEELYVSCCGVDEKGEALMPSDVFIRLREYVEARMDESAAGNSVSVIGDLNDEPNVFRMITSKAGTLSYMTDALRNYNEGAALDDDWLQVISWYEDNCADELSRVKKGMLFDNRLEALGADFADSLYRGDRSMLEVSASRLERYSSCPFAHFIMYGLRAQEPRIYEIGAREIGDVYHRCLMRLSRSLTPEAGSGMSVNDPGSPWMSITEEECRSEVRRIISSDAEYYRDGILVSGREEEYRMDRIVDICSMIAWSMVQQVRKGRIKEMCFEYPFGSGKKLPPVRVDLGERQVLIQGIIDRMDILSSEESGADPQAADAKDAVRIIDYKTGSDSVNPEYFSKGYKLQLMVYMKAALEAAGGNERGMEPAGVFYFRIKDMDTDADVKAVRSGREAFEERVADAYRLEGIVLNDDAVIDSMDGEIDGVSHVIPVKVNKKEGGYVQSAGGHLMSADEFDELYRQVDNQVQRVCREICDGNIEIKPKQERIKDMQGNRRNACRYCTYRSICMFDTSFEGCRYEQV